MDNRLKAIQREYKEIKRDKANGLQKDHIADCLKLAKANRWKSKKAKARFERLRRMKQREEARRRRRAQGKGYNGGLQAIQVPTTTVEDGREVT